MQSYKYRVLSADPGIQNFAYVIFDVNFNLEENLLNIESINILQFGFIHDNIKDLTSFDLLSYLKHKELNLEYDFNLCVIERYQARLQGPVNEIINFNILNFISSLKSKIQELKLLLPTTWKRFYKEKEFDLLHHLQQELKLQKILKKTLKVHHLDALCMGIYETFNLVLKPELLKFKKKEAAEILNNNKKNLTTFLKTNLLNLNWANYIEL